MKNSSDKMTEFSQIYSRNKTKLYNYVFKMLYDREASEDIIQTVFLKLYEKIDSLDEINNIDAWLFIIARNEIYSFMRKKKIRREYNKETDMQIVEFNSKFDLMDQIELKDFKEHLRKELSEIDDGQREVFLLKEYGGFSYKEISEMLAVDIDLVKSRLYKVRQKLIKNLSKIVN